jgi:hypothetical protein
MNVVGETAISQHLQVVPVQGEDFMFSAANHLQKLQCWPYPSARSPMASKVYGLVSQSEPNVQKEGSAPITCRLEIAMGGIY